MCNTRMMPSPRQSTKLALSVYRGLSRLLRPLLEPALEKRRDGLLLVRGWQRNAAELHAYSMNAHCRSSKSDQLIWFHGASIGESMAMIPLMAKALRNLPQARVLLTVTSSSAPPALDRKIESLRLMAASQNHENRTDHTKPGERVSLRFLPFDFCYRMEEFFDCWKPCIGILSESEFWPNMILCATQRSIPLVLVNGGISTSSYTRWSNWSVGKDVLSYLLSSFTMVFAKDVEQQSRMRRIVKHASNPPTIDYLGNLKEEPQFVEVDSMLEYKRDAVLQHIQPSTKTVSAWLAVSTHEGEDEVILAAHKEMIQQSDIRLTTILAPRHPERCDHILKSIEQHSLSCVLHSSVIAELENFLNQSTPLEAQDNGAQQIQSTANSTQLNQVEHSDVQCSRSNNVKSTTNSTQLNQVEHNEVQCSRSNNVKSTTNSTQLNQVEHHEVQCSRSNHAHSPSESQGSKTTNPDIYLIDSLGEMDVFYSIVDVVFVGASLSSSRNKNGHNILEPANAGCTTVLFGPNISVGKYISHSSTKFREVDSASEIASVVKENLSLKPRMRLRVATSDSSSLISSNIWDHIEKQMRNSTHVP